MENILIESKSKETTRLLLNLSRHLNLRHKKFTKSELEDFLIGRSIKEGLKSGYVPKSKVLKALGK
jgi:Fe-S cluster biosynthesis and repair protein YggX